ISDRCGAATEIHADLGQVLSLDDSVNDWADAMDEQLKGNYEAIAYQRNWQHVALEYLAVYQQIQITQERL
ncbi:MAG: hypothetical protein Q9M18_02275, partial [Mariprofundaceae bacterium]|nr:hypothetical protein [Mariprofundaceae bacterium]